MYLLDIARGPVLQIAIGIFVLGTVWRVVSLFLLPHTHELSAAKPGAKPKWLAGAREIARRFMPDREFARRVRFSLINGYVFHFGLLLTVVAFAPHILFFEDLIGFSWPALPNNVIFAIGAITLGSLVAQLFYRLGNPVLKVISTFDDYFSWLVTALPVVTGLVASSHLGARYETLLALHILSVALFLVWLPFGKLMHFFLVFVTRGQTGAHLSHRGTQL